MFIACSKNQGLLFALRIDIFYQFLNNRPIERARDYCSIKRFNIKFQLVFQFSQFFNRIGFGIINFRTFAFFPFDTFRIQFCLNLIWRLMVYQVTVYYRFPIRISKDWRSKYIGCMKCRSSSQTNDKGIKVFDDTLILAYIVGLVSERKVFFIQLLVFIISSMCFIHNDAIVCING